MKNNVKDALDLKPAMEFVNRHIDVYEKTFRRLMFASTQSANVLTELVFINETYLSQAGSQINPAQIRQVLSRLPISFLKLSVLKTVDYTKATSVPVPTIDKHGVWNNGAEWVPMSQFPREHDHPTRILTGYSNKTSIYMTAIPKSICANERACWFYQLHILLHEFFHTIESPRRDEKKRADICYVFDGKKLTLQNWWSRWETIFTSSNPPIFPTRYASTYENGLNQTILNENYPMFTRALAEQICESFVGYILNIVPNDEDNPSFQSHSMYAWQLINELATATIID